MASNRLPDQLDRLLTLCHDMEDGLNTHETVIGVLQNTKTVLSAARSTAEAAETDFQGARASKPGSITAQTIADSNGKLFIATARGVLSNYLGSQWTNAWDATGFINGSLAIPGTIGERQALLFSLKNYFAAHGGQESPPLVTTAHASTLATALATARSSVNNCQLVIAQTKTARDTAVTTLRKRMRGLIDELATLITDDDPRWYAFGLNRPADPQTPGIPDGLIATPGAAGVIYLDWADARRADHYRVWKQIIGVDTEYLAVASPTDSDATLTGLPSGATVSFQITAINDAGESQPSAAVSVVVP